MVLPFVFTRTALLFNGATVRKDRTTERGIRTVVNIAAYAVSICVGTVVNALRDIVNTAVSKSSAEIIAIANTVIKKGTTVASTRIAVGKSTQSVLWGGGAIKKQ
jgi:hypothetical protein